MHPRAGRTRGSYRRNRLAHASSCRDGESRTARAEPEEEPWRSQQSTASSWSTRWSDRASRCCSSAPSSPTGSCRSSSEPALADRYQLIRYHKRGWVGSTHTPAPVSVADHAADAAALLDHLGCPRAHVAGHSSGGGGRRPAGPRPSRDRAHADPAGAVAALGARAARRSSSRPDRRSRPTPAATTRARWPSS